MEGENHDMPALGTIRKLRPHPTARLADALPPAALVARYVVPTGDNSLHLLWMERKPHRKFDADGQATFCWRSRTYNVARVLLQHRLKCSVVRAVNACGLPQCVKPAHWNVEPSFLGVVAAPVGFATVRVDGVWRLSIGGETAHRDVVFVASIEGSPTPRDTHVIRALHDEHETVFLTACGRVVDPAGVVAQLADATCPGCVS